MARCVIFCAAGFDRLLEPLSPEDYVIAADGGLAHVKKLGITPDRIMGDFDSLGYVPQDSQVFPTEKDDTDTMLAVKTGLALGYREFLLYGSLDGPRLDHTVANFQVLQYLSDRGANGYLIGLTTVAAMVKNGFLEMPETAEGIVSVFCQGADAAGVTLQGLYYPLSDSPVSAGVPIGVSNEFTGVKSRISVKEGHLLVLYSRDCGLPATHVTGEANADL